MAKTYTTKRTELQAIVQRKEALIKMGFDVKKLDRATPRTLTDAQRAKLLEVKVAELKSPFLLTPAKPKNGKSHLTLYSSMMVYPIYPADSGEALFSSMFQGAVFPGAQVSFPRLKTGKMHLVEFNVALNMNLTYKFRVFQYPLGDFQDISIQGPKTTTLTALVPPVDQISGNLELGASIQNRNTQMKVPDGFYFLLE